MSKITGDEKRWWHDDQGRHRMPDLRGTDYPRKFWDDDERAYHRHLDRHDELAKIPEPEEDDSDTIKALFQSIDIHERTIEATRELIISLRRSNTGN